MLQTNLDKQDALANGLSELFARQREVSGLIPGHISDEPTNYNILLGSFALIGEVFELAQELGWKDWKDNKEMTAEHRAVIAEEFADILAFLGYLLHLVVTRADLSVDVLAEAYFAKTEKNVARFEGTSGEAGYSGVVASQPETPEQLAQLPLFYF